MSVKTIAVRVLKALAEPEVGEEKQRLFRDAGAYLFPVFSVADVRALAWACLNRSREAANRGKDNATPLGRKPKKNLDKCAREK